MVLLTGVHDTMRSRVDEMRMASKGIKREEMEVPMWKKFKQPGQQDGTLIVPSNRKEVLSLLYLLCSPLQVVSHGPSSAGSHKPYRGIGGDNVVHTHPEETMLS